MTAARRHARTVVAGIEDVGSDGGLRERHKRKRVTDILRAAGSLFKANGYDATTIAQIADEADVSQVTVFNYYGSKATLLLALISQENAEILKLVREISPSKRDRVADVVCTFFSTITNESLKQIDKDAWRQVIASRMTSGASEFSAAYEALRDDLKASFVSLLERMQQSGRLKTSRDVKVLSDLAYAFHYHLFMEFVAQDEMSSHTYQSALRVGMTELFSD